MIESSWTYQIKAKVTVLTRVQKYAFTHFMILSMPLYRKHGFCLPAFLDYFESQTKGPNVYKLFFLCYLSHSLYDIEVRKRIPKTILREFMSADIVCCSHKESTKRQFLPV
jgi:hypothetical protein